MPAATSIPTRRFRRLSIDSKSYRSLKNLYIPDRYMSNSISPLLSDTTESHSSIDQGDKIIEWRDRKIHKMGSKGGWPIDHIELERQEAEHHLLRILLGFPYHGPVLETLNCISGSNWNKKKILDIGTGTGVWAIDMADLFPHADVIGLDEICIQPELVPPNCEFHIWDFLRPLPYNSSSFDIIHIRFLQNLTPYYLPMITQALSLLKPGGLLLIFENFNILPQLKDQEKLLPKGVQAFYDAYSRSLREPKLDATKLEDVLSVLRGQDGGLVKGKIGGGGNEIKGDAIMVPIGHGSGKMDQLSKIHLINLKGWLDSTRYMIIQFGGYTDSEFDVLSEACIKDMEKEELFTCYHSLWVRKG